MWIDRWANNNNLAFVFLQETRVNTNSQFETPSYMWCFSSSIDIDDIGAISKIQESGQRPDRASLNKVKDHIGVGIMVYKRICRPYVMYPLYPFVSCV